MTEPSKTNNWVKTNSKSLNTLFQGFPRGQLSLLYVGGANQDLFRLALMRLFGHPVNHRLKIYDFHGDCSGDAAALYKLPSGQTEIKTGMRYQMLMPSIVQDVRGPNPPDVLIVNDLDALIRVNPNDYSRLMAIVMNTPTAVVMIVPVATERDPRKTKFMRVLKRLEVALPVTYEAGFGELVENEWAFTIQIKRSKYGFDMTRKVQISLPYKDIPEEQRARKRIIPSQVIARGKFPDRGIEATAAAHGGGAGMERVSYDAGIGEQPMRRPGELRDVRPVVVQQPRKPPVPVRPNTVQGKTAHAEPPVGGAIKLSDDPRVMVRQLDARSAAQQSQPTTVAQPSVSLAAPVRQPQPAPIREPIQPEPEPVPVESVEQEPEAPPIPEQEDLPMEGEGEAGDVEQEVIAAEPTVATTDDQDAPSIPDEALAGAELPDLDFSDQEEPGFECISCKRTYHATFRSAKVSHLALCKYCTKEQPLPPDQVPKSKKELVQYFCKHCGSPDTKPISAQQEAPDGFKQMFKCKACGKTFMHTTPFGEEEEQEVPAEAPPRTVRGMQIIGDKGSPVLGQQKMARPGEAISANAALKARRNPTQPTSAQVEIAADQQVRRVVNGMPVQSGDTQIDATAIPASQSLNPRPRVSPQLAARMVSSDKVVQHGPISMRVQVKGDNASIGSGVVAADALAGSRGKTDKKNPGGIHTLRI